MPAALLVEPHEDPGQVHQAALLAEDDVEEVPVLSLPSSPPQGNLGLLVLTVPVGLGILRYINPETSSDLTSCEKYFKTSCFHLQ